MARPWLINFCLPGLLAILLGVWNTDHAASGRSFRLMFERWTPIMALKYATRNMSNKRTMPYHWEKELAAKMVRIEATALAASRRLDTYSLETTAVVLDAALRTGNSAKVASKFKRYYANNCGYFVGKSEDLCGTAVRLHIEYRSQDAIDMFLRAMKRFQRGIDCYATRFSLVLRNRDLTPALGLEGFSAEVRRRDTEVLGRYHSAAVNSYSMRVHAYQMWSSLRELERAVQHVMGLTWDVLVTNEDAIERAESELKAGIGRRNLSPYEQALALITQDKAEGESGIGASRNDIVGLSKDGQVGMSTNDDVYEEKSEAAEGSDDSVTTSTDDGVTSMEDGGAITTPDGGARVVDSSGQNPQGVVEGEPGGTDQILQAMNEMSRLLDSDSAGQDNDSIDGGSSVV